MIATQMGVEPTMTAAYPDPACCSAQTTRPLPPSHSSVPEAMSTPSSARVSRSRCRSAPLASSRIAPATRVRMAAMVNGGKPDPSRTATRIAR